MGTALQKCFTPSAETELQVVFFVQRLNRVFKKGKFESVLLHQSQKLLPCLWVVPEIMLCNEFVEKHLIIRPTVSQSLQVRSQSLASFQHHSKHLPFNETCHNLVFDQFRQGEKPEVSQHGTSHSLAVDLLNTTHHL